MPLSGMIVFARALLMQALTGPPTEEATEDQSSHSYDYLLSMPIHSLTTEKVQAPEIALLHSMPSC